MSQSLLLETVVGPFWVWLAHGEVPSGRAFLGGAIVIAALAGHAIAALRRGPAEEEAPE